MFVLPTLVNGQQGEWKVWVKTTPCSGRNDWISVAKNNPTGGENFFYLANQIFPGTTCTTEGCTFTIATAVAATLRTSSEFFKYCCHDYSVWKNSQTGKMTIVVGKFGTAGFGWDPVKGELCCEEAEALAGIPGACSGTTQNNQPSVQNTKCWPGSYAAWNAQTQRVECYCKTGLVWNSTRTACVDPQELVRNADCSVYPGSYAAWNAQTQTVECWCPPGKKWNDTKTACITDAVTTNTQCWPGSYAVWNAQTQRTECFCNAGLVWNSTRTACVNPQELVRNTNCSVYPGSYAAWNAQNQRVECWCPPGKIWNDTKTACIDNVAQVSCWPGSYAAFNPQTNRTECFCNPGLVWNSTKTACIEPGKINDGKIEGSANLNWVLDSVTVSPKNPKETWTHNEWSYSVQSPSAHYSIYDGAYQVDFNWTPPPQQFNSNGFTVSLNVQAKTTGGQDIAALISVSGSGLTSDTPYSSSSKAIASFVVINNSYSSLLPTIIFSNSLNPVPAGIG